MIEGRFRSVVEHGSVAISLLDGMFLPIYSNNIALEMAGRTEEECRQINWIDIVHADDKPQLQKILEAVRQSVGSTYTASFRIRHKQGMYVWIEVSFINMLHENAANAIVCS